MVYIVFDIQILRITDILVLADLGVVVLPLVGVVTQVGVLVDGYLKVSASAAGEKVSVYLVEGDARVDVDALFFELHALENEHRHELSEQLLHHIEAVGASGHVINGVAHGEENSFDTASPWRVVEFGIAVCYIRNAYKIVCLLHFAECFLEAFQAADPTEHEVFCGGEAV